ncbi:MAG: tRNA (guanosine(46)-N7)-methyltransferase TrmB [Gammaproteobacteria bacterium]
MTSGQQRALDTLWPIFGVDSKQPLNFSQLFAQSAPVTLEIGFGNGRSLASMALASPDENFLGIEVHRPGAGQLLRQLETQEINNVRIICDDAIEILRTSIPALSLNRVLLFFPDPWPKTKHRKRRIVQPDFVRLIASRLQQGGVFHMATDWQPYAKHMLSTLSESSDFINTVDTLYANRPDYRPETKFERRGLQLGHTVKDLIFRKK